MTGPAGVAAGPAAGAGAVEPGPVRRVLGRLFVALPLLFAIVAEAAWISVLAGLAQEYSLHEPGLGIAALAGFVAFGVVAARTLGVRLGDRWPTAGALLCLGGGLVGWLSAPDVREALATDGFAVAITTHPAGWLGTLAVARGFAHARLPLSEPTLAHLLGLGVPTLALAAIIGGMVAEPFRGRFLGEAILASIVFMTSATLALALTRLAAVGADSGFDWRRNPTWFALLTVLVVVTAMIAVLVSSIAGPVIAFVIGAAIGPVLIVGLVVGFDRRSIRIILISVVVAVGVAAIIRLIGGRGAFTIDLGIGAPPAEVVPTQPGEEVVLGGGLLLLLALLAVLILARLWMRRIPLVEEDVAESRSIDRSEPGSRPRRRARRRPDPVDAVTAYLALVEDLEPLPAARREPAESPAEHARRLREAGRGGLELDLLAADYALVRFGGVGLSPGEDRRGVARWRALRSRLGRVDGVRAAVGRWGLRAGRDQNTA